MAGERMVILNYVAWLLIAAIGANSVKTLIHPPLRPFEYKESKALLATPHPVESKDSVIHHRQLQTSTSKTQTCMEVGCIHLKRKRRVVGSHKKFPLEEPLLSGNSQAVLSPFPTLDPAREKKPSKSPRNKLGRGNRNNKSGGARRNNPMNGEDLEKSIRIGFPEKKGRKKLQSKKSHFPMREGQTPRRLRQHMQHKKKVKQFLQKRIQEQIEQRSQNRDFDF